ncbi:MAG: hypothetical protein JSW26_27740 [Desulfobacterales bacterium]|nr:MAG: hypothetical protein JSW26_27740 [Desulfobacterales bacterium]
MLRIRDFPKRLMGASLLLLIITGCASFGQVEIQPITSLKPRELPAGNGWWSARFHLHWPPDTEPVWYMDLCLAHQVVLPLLESYKNDIYLWRFHRRAARDAAGRMFSFIFYASPQTARHIFNDLRTDPLIKKLKDAHVLDLAEYDDPTHIARPNIEDTGDKQWPVSIQKTWPYYIMGASQMWLNLIAEVAAENLEGSPPSTLGEIEAFYQQVDQTITMLWQQEGRHAFMHHLNALFEYEPLVYWEKRYMNF